MRPIATRTLVSTALVLAASLPAACGTDHVVSPQANLSPTGGPSGSGDPPRWTPLDPGGNGTEPLAPGAYGLQANGLVGMPVAVMDLPAGFADLGGWAVLDPKIVRGVGYWTVSGVDRDPCGEPLDLLDPGRTVEDLADSFAEQQLTDLTPPVPVEVGGYSGLYAELRAPDDIDFATCGQGKFELWVSDPGGGRYMQEPGQVDRLWILDVNGDRVVLMATAVPGVSEAQMQELTEIVGSTRFVESK